MPFPTSVNDQIVDSVTQENTQVLGDSPAMALSSLLVSNGGGQNDAGAALSTQAVTPQGLNTLYSIDTASAGVVASNIFGANSLFGNNEMHPKK